MEHQSPAVAPLTPSRRTERHGALRVTRVEIKMILDDLTRTWDLRLEMPPENESPSKRLGRPQTPEQRCVALITALSYKNYHVEPITSFKKTAKFLWSGWMLKPKGEKDVIPRATRDREHPLTNSERKLMIELLLTHLEGPGAELKEKNKTPRHLRPTLDSDGTPIFKDDPIAFPLSTPDPKRACEEPVSGAEKPTKKCKFPETRPTPFSKSDPNAMLPPDRGRQSFKDTGGYRSVNTSFGSTSSSSVFSVNQSFGYPMLPDTQETAPDLGEQSSQKTQEFPNTASTKSSDYGAGSNFDADLINAVDSDALLLNAHVDTERAEASISSQLDGFGIQSFNRLTDEDILQERLGDVFPKLPPSLEKAPLHVVYEITRVFAHAGVSISDIKFPGVSTFSNYNILWDFLRHLPILEGKSFPDKSDPLAWEAANGDYTYKGSGVVLGGSLKFNYTSETGPFFHFRLKPLSLDRRARLGRKLGEDRLLILDMPHLRGKDVPKILQGEDGQNLLWDWLVDEPHWLFGRSWKPFHTKPKVDKNKQERKKAKKDKKENKKEETSHHVYFFAVSGNGLGQRSQSPEGEVRPNIEIPKLLNENVRLTRKNKHHSYLKLFSRTGLALSRNTPTMVFELFQIRYMDDIKVNDKDMTDGAGRISPAAAAQVREHLGLSFLPSGFQGRLGEAKGFWSIDHSDLSDEIWIECYTSQCKWVRTKRRDLDYPDNDVNNRTFEVVKTSGPLKSADLNTQFLNILVERAEDKEQMRLALRHLLEVGLQSELDNLLTSSDDAQLLRKWVQDKSPNDQLRIKHGQVHYEAGLPKLPSEILVMLLDAGFETKQLNYAMELCKKLFRSKCDELKDRLNITVGKSTYAYMVPDFYGVLEENEVYINCPTFTDDVHGTTGDSLFGWEVLVTRTPAHFASDVQKVRVVAKTELMGLRDVIVFPTKGFPSLADKLSGGDYDGDIAWVCWEPSLVNNFVNAPVPDPMPELVEEGFITKDETTYGDLVHGHDNPDSYFLKQALSFNMQPSILGICTAWKDKFCYNLGDLGAPESIRICALLSNLVDQAKQGYSFPEENWKRFKNDLMDSVKTRNPKFKLLEQEHKKELPRCHEKSKHIVDYLTWAAKTKVDKSFTEFEQTLSPNIPHWDEDVVAFARWAEKTRDDEIKNKKEAEKAAEEKGKRPPRDTYGWNDILLDLNNDLIKFKDSWADAHGKRDCLKDKDELESYSALVLRYHEMYKSIVPHKQNSITQLLLADYGHPDLSEWSLFKASVFFFSHKNRKNSISDFVWQMAGKQLAHLKARRNANGAPHSVVPSMYSIYRPNNGMIKQLQTRNLGFVEGLGVGVGDGKEGEEWDVYGEEEEL